MGSDLSAPPASVRIRQIALCTDDIWREEQAIIASLGVAGVHRDPPNPFKMRNTVFAVGDTFLEVLQPESDDAPSAKYLSKRGGPGGYMLILQVDDIDAARRRVDELGIRVVFDAAKHKSHGVVAAALHLHPADTGGALISLDQMDPPEGWAWAGTAWQAHVHTDIVDRIVAVELGSAEPDALAERFARLVGRDVGDGGVVELDESSVRFARIDAGLPDQLTVVDVRATDRNRAGSTVEISGTTIRFV